MPGFQDPDIHRIILETLRIGVCVIDRQRKIVLWSDGAEIITGYLRHEVVGHSSAENVLLHCDQAKCTLCGEKCPLTAALYDARPVESVGSLHHRDGHRTPVRSWIVPVRDQRGTIIGATHTFDGQRVIPSPDRRDADLSEYGCLDILTGMANHAMMQSHLRETLGTFAELHVPFGIIRARLDDLDQFRANYGLEAANSLLRLVAQTLEDTLRPTDFVGRWSEDQFLGILVGCRESTLLAVCERTNKMIRSAGMLWWGEQLSPAVSLGHASVAEGDTVELVLQRAQSSLDGLGSAPRAYSAAVGSDRKLPKG
jgi:diguanylate cyclase (GGDEF)-like protein/PAS domain S-box-containing protein